MFVLRTPKPIEYIPVKVDAVRIARPIKPETRYMINIKIIKVIIDIFV